MQRRVAHPIRRGIARERIHSEGPVSSLPVFAAGNGDVDIEMLESATFALVINHDDDEREFAYTTGAEKALEKAADLGWTVVSIKDDWNSVFGDSPAA